MSGFPPEKQGKRMYHWNLVMLAMIAFLSSAGCTSMNWSTIHNPLAVCNDFTPGGFFISQVSGGLKWIIFLESGGACYTEGTCNNRYFRETARTEQNYAGVDGIFNPAKAKAAILEQGLEQLQSTLSPLMTSMLTFSDTPYFRDGLRVEGRGILDRDCSVNPLYCYYNHVVLPYCSSDLWLANGPAPSSCNISSDLYDACYADYTYKSCKAIAETFFRSCFLTGNRLNFVHRGSTIFRAAMQQLVSDFGLDKSQEILLVGSSAGGIGAINQAKWLHEFLKSNAPNSTLSVIADSAWFINFQENIYTKFSGLVRNSSITRETADILDILQVSEEVNITCNDISYGSPCCLSAYCMLTNSNYYPSQEVPILAIFSLYDVYLLSDSLKYLSEMGQDTLDSSTFIAYLQTVQEYGGAMNITLSLTVNRAGKFSYIVTECFQHIYFVTSTLWGENGILGTETVEVSKDILHFRHLMDANVWKTLKLKGNITIHDALTIWNSIRFSQQTLRIGDECHSPYCNIHCPERFVLRLIGDSWSLEAKATLIILVILVTVVCLMFKAAFFLWYLILTKKQGKYLRSLADDTENNVEEALEFPQCEEVDIISIACKNLSYSVNVKPDNIKDEKRDATHPIVLNTLETQQNKDAKLQFRRSLHSYYGAHSRSNTLTSNTKKSRLSSTKDQEHMMDIKKQSCFGGCRQTNKHILKTISTFFNAGELIGIMGPSGCGKTTFLDILTGRNKPTEGEIFVNGLPVDEVYDWYINNIGYVLQLAMPYYEKLTVRENLSLAAQIKLPSSFTQQQKFERVEQVMAVTGLLPLADVAVGMVSGPGISGGEKRRLTVALQIIKMPSVIVLDEPTSGLDASSSYELLTHLNKLADSNRTVIVTIHQPRLEIFHLFHRLVLLTDGKVAYNGLPEKAFGAFVTALKARCLEEGFVIPEVEDHNPADVLMDILGNPKMRETITEYYEHSGEQSHVLEAIAKLQQDNVNRVQLYILGRSNELSRGKQDSARIFTRLAALEARSAKQSGPWQLFYLPSIFLAYGLLLGTVYLQTDESLLVLSGFCVYSVASALFIFPALYAHYQKALEIYDYEHADGLCRPWDLIVQGFIKAVYMSIIPVILCAGMLYLLLVERVAYSWASFGQVLIVNMALNQTWIALLIFLICAFPRVAFRLSPIISSIAGFTSGFFIPRDSIPLLYRWICYINPNYYGLFASAKVLLSSYNTDCEGRGLPCIANSGPYVLRNFDMDDTNPYLHIAVLLGFTFFYTVAAVIANVIRSSPLKGLLRHRRKQRKQDGKFVVNSTELEMDLIAIRNTYKRSQIARQHWRSAYEKCRVQLTQKRNKTTRGRYNCKSNYQKTLSSIQERQKRVARQVSTTMVAMKSIEGDITNKVLHKQGSLRYTYCEALKLYEDELTNSMQIMQTSQDIASCGTIEQNHDASGKVPMLDASSSIDNTNEQKRSSEGKKASVKR